MTDINVVERNYICWEDDVPDRPKLVVSSSPHQAAKSFAEDYINFTKSFTRGSGVDVGSSANITVVGVARAIGYRFRVGCRIAVEERPLS